MNKTIVAKIKDCGYTNYWYFDKIGRCYEVEDTGRRSYMHLSGYRVVNNNDKLNLFIKEEDCIVITRKMKLDRIKDKILEKTIE